MRMETCTKHWQLGTVRALPSHQSRMNESWTSHKHPEIIRTLLFHPTIMASSWLSRRQPEIFYKRSMRHTRPNTRIATSPRHLVFWPGSCGVLISILLFPTNFIISVIIIYRTPSPPPPEIPTAPVKIDQDHRRSIRHYAHFPGRNREPCPKRRSARVRSISYIGRLQRSEPRYCYGVRSDRLHWRRRNESS